MTLRQIRCAVFVARCGSMSKAAPLLGVSQSAVTVNLAALERELGGKVFDRSPFGVTLTELGAMLLPLFEQMVAVEDAIEAAVVARRS